MKAIKGAMNQVLPSWAKNALRRVKWEKKQAVYTSQMKKRLSETAGRRIFLFDTCEHGNIGDHAILSSEMRMLSNWASNVSVVQVPTFFHESFAQQFRETVGAEDLVLIHGGGFLGTIWNEPYDIVLKNFPNRKIIILPQTIFYEDSLAGREKLKREYPLFQNNNVAAFVRERNSLEFMQREFYAQNPDQCKLVPDIVLTYETDITYQPENKMIFCLRTDKERVRDDSFHDKVVQVANDAGLEVEHTDMMAGHAISPADSERYVNQKLEQLSKGKFVVTDRLHCMIFCALTGTPCIAMDNSSGKVKGVYEAWLKDVDYIRFCQGEDEILQAAEEFCQMERIHTQRYRPEQLESAFEPLKNAIQQWYGEGQ